MINDLGHFNIKLIDKDKNEKQMKFLGNKNKNLK